MTKTQFLTDFFSDVLFFRNKCTYCGGDIEDDYPTGWSKNVFSFFLTLFTGCSKNVKKKDNIITKEIKNNPLYG